MFLGTETVVDLVANDNNEVVLNDIGLGNNSEEQDLIFNPSYHDIGIYRII